MTLARISKLRVNRKARRKCNIRPILDKNSLGALNKIGWLADQPSGFKDWARSVCQVRTLAAGQYLYHAGDEADGIYGLRSGSIDIEFPLVADEPVALTRKNEGFWIGDAALLARTDRIVSVVTVVESTFAFLPGPAIKSLLSERPEHWPSFYDLSTRNVNYAVTLLAETLSLTVRARVCRALLDLSTNRKEAQITQEALSKTLGIARPTLRRCLSDLASQGCIENRYRRVDILDKPLLSSYINEQ